MLKSKVKISKVNNLTDARYFAAMGVDYLGFCCNPGTEMFCAPSKIKEITEWVEGPGFVLEMDGWQNEEDIFGLLKTGLGQCLHFGAFSTYTTTFGVPVFKDFIFENIHNIDFSGVDFPVLRSEKHFSELTTDDIMECNQLITGKNVFLDFHFNVEELEEMMDALNFYGLILRGGHEEKTGVKSFENLDKIFESLED
ncbi:MAG: hypothetical protein IPN89_01420 [Saprospiraceae bacterium]|nr:hypothetical protein [Saprospiraceae bacterium]MBL0099354.1 hypothetical protein [Saprospiraceae bacterium]